MLRTSALFALASCLSIVLSGTAGCASGGGSDGGNQSNVSLAIPAGAGLHVLTLDGYFAAESGAYSITVRRP